MSFRSSTRGVTRRPWCGCRGRVRGGCEGWTPLPSTLSRGATPLPSTRSRPPHPYPKAPLQSRPTSCSRASTLSSCSGSLPHPSSPYSTLQEWKRLQTDLNQPFYWTETKGGFPRFSLSQFLHGMGPCLFPDVLTHWPAYCSGVLTPQGMIHKYGDKVGATPPH